MNIELEEKEMQVTCIQMKRTILNLEICVKDLDMILLSVGNEWQGESEIIYTKKLLMAKNQYKKILESLSSFEEELTQLLNDFTKFDNENAARILQV